MRRTATLLAVWCVLAAAACRPRDAATEAPPAAAAPATHSSPAAGGPGPPASAAPRTADNPSPRAAGLATPPASAAPRLTPVADPARTTFAGTTLEQDALVAQLRSARPLSFTPVGSTSTVFRARLDAPIDMAFKSQTRDRPRGPVAEVAAYRIARCLGLDSVPPATLRRVPLEALRATQVPAARAQWPDIEPRVVVDPRGRVLGAAIYWVPDLRDVGIDTGEGIRQWSEWLTLGGQIPEESRSLMAYLSSM